MFNDELVLGEKEGGDCNLEGRVSGFKSLV
jgi:hypothetical protein